MGTELSLILVMLVELLVGYCILGRYPERVIYLLINVYIAMKCFRFLGS